MLRHYDQHGGGVKVYTSRLIRALLDLRTEHEFVLLYRNPALLGTYAGERGVEEVALTARSVLGWDQLAVPEAVQRHGIDVLFNPKYSIPLRARCRTVWVCHGLDWYVMPWGSKLVDRLSHRFLVPRYARKADAIVAVSEVTRRHVMEYLAVPPDRVATVYSGVDDVFRRPLSPSRRDEIRKKYSLPERFLLYAGAIYPPKNFTRLVQAYARVGPERGIPLVVAGGENRFLSEGELRQPEALGIAEWVRWPGWIEQEELAEGAAVLVEFESVESIADGIRRALVDTALRAELIAAGRVRSQDFTWRRCALETLGVLERVGSTPQRGRAAPVHSASAARSLS